MKYTATLVATYEIEAENIVQARRAAESIRSIGERVGCRRVSANDREWTRYRVTLGRSSVTVVRAGQPAKAPKR